MWTLFKKFDWWNWSKSSLLPRWRFFSSPEYLETVFFLLNSKGDASLQCTACDYCQADWGDLHSYLRDVLWHNIVQLSTSTITTTTTTTTEYSEWLQVGIDACIPHQKNQVMAHSSPWFSAACADAIAYRSHLFHLYSQNVSSTSKLADAIKIKESVNWLTLVLVNF